MSKLRTELENQVFYRNLTAPEWKEIRGNWSNIELKVCLRLQVAADDLKEWLRLAGV